MKWNEIPSFTECRLINPFSYGFLSYVDYIENGEVEFDNASPYVEE